MGRREIYDLRFEEWRVARLSGGTRGATSLPRRGFTAAMRLQGVAALNGEGFGVHLVHEFGDVTLARA
jgi:hypothetical protein